MIGDFETFDGLYKIGKGHEYYRGFSSYVMDKNNAPFWDFFNTRKFRISPKVISSRTMNHWQNEGLLPDNCQEEGQKWRNFTLMDLVWVATVKELREIGVNFSIIQEAKKRLISRYNSCEYGELEFYTALAYFQKRPCEILIFRDGSAEVATTYEINDSKEKYGLITHINLSINGILQSIFRDQDLKPVFENWIDLDEKEIKVLQMIKSGDYEEVSLKFNNGNTIIINEKSRKDKKKLHELLREGGDQDLIVKVRKGEVSHIEQTKIEKL